MYAVAEMRYVSPLSCFCI